jgi:hypothetical protein
LTEEGGLGFWERALTIIAVCGLVGGALIDFYIGKPGQRRVRDRLETWWLRLSDVRWGNFGREEALFAVEVMDRLFGRRLFSFRRMLVVVLTSAFVCSILIVIMIIEGHTLYLTWWREFYNDSPQQDPDEAINWVTFIIILFSLATSFSFTRFAAVTIAKVLTRAPYLNLAGIVCVLSFQYLLFCYVGSFSQTFASSDMRIAIDFEKFKLLSYYRPNSELRWTPDMRQPEPLLKV